MRVDRKRSVGRFVLEFLGQRGWLGPARANPSRRQVRPARRWTARGRLGADGRALRSRTIAPKRGTSPRVAAKTGASCSRSARACSRKFRRVLRVFVLLVGQRRPCLRRHGRRSRAVPSRRAFSNYFGERVCPTRGHAAAFLVGRRRRCAVGVASTTAGYPSPPLPSTGDVAVDPTRASPLREGRVSPPPRPVGRKSVDWRARRVGGIERRDRTTAAVLRLPLPALRLRFPLDESDRLHGLRWCPVPVAVVSSPRLPRTRPACLPRYPLFCFYFFFLVFLFVFVINFFFFFFFFYGLKLRRTTIEA